MRRIENLPKQPGDKPTKEVLIAGMRNGCSISDEL